MIILNPHYQELTTRTSEIIDKYISMLAFTSALVGSHHFFSRKDKNNIEGIIATDIELYKKIYYKQFKEHKLKNIMISIGAKALLAGAIMALICLNQTLV